MCLVCKSNSCQGKEETMSKLLIYTTGAMVMHDMDMASRLVQRYGTELASGLGATAQSSLNHIHCVHNLLSAEGQDRMPEFSYCAELISPTEGPNAEQLVVISALVTLLLTRTNTVMLVIDRAATRACIMLYFKRTRPAPITTTAQSLSC
jgi:hypothetical protein